MRPFLVRIAVVAGIGAAAVAIALALGRSASAGLYIAGAILVLAAISRAGMVIGAYGEHAGVDQIKENNASRAVFLFAGILLLVLGAVVESL